MGAANSTGGVMGKMIDAQSIVGEHGTGQAGRRDDLQSRVRPQHRARVPGLPDSYPFDLHCLEADEFQRYLIRASDRQRAPLRVLAN